MTRLKPLVGIITCASVEDNNLFFKAGDKYIRAIHDYAHSTPLLIPSLGDDLDMESLFGKLDGILFTGSLSNVSPNLYEGGTQRPGKRGDDLRDSTSLPLLLRALDIGKPILCICRGHQELNVALGGSLYTHVHEVDGKLDHREHQDRDWQESYRVKHAVHLTEGGKLAALNNGELTANVNSLHWQAIDRKAENLFVEATAPDGVIEAVSVPSASGYVLSVQWHPEHPYALEDSLNRNLFADFYGAMA